MTGRHLRAVGQPDPTSPVGAPAPAGPVGPPIPPGPRTVWELVHPARPTPMNAYRRLHPHARARYDRLWRRTFADLARRARVPHLDAVIITVGQWCLRPPLPDPGANFPTAKAAVDGLVDAGVLTDDSSEFVRYLGFAAPERGPEDLFLLSIELYTEETAP